MTIGDPEPRADTCGLGATDGERPLANLLSLTVTNHAIIPLRDVPLKAHVTLRLEPAACAVSDALALTTLFSPPLPHSF